MEEIWSGSGARQWVESRMCLEEDLRAGSRFPVEFIKELFWMLS